MYSMVRLILSKSNLALYLPSSRPTWALILGAAAVVVTISLELVFVGKGYGFASGLALAVLANVVMK